MLTFCIVIIMLATFASIANSQPVLSLQNGGVVTDSHLAHIFNFKNQNETLLIDFDIIKEAIQTVNVLKNGEIVRTEDVAELPEDVLYELKMNRLSKGNYTIELVTNTHRITKEIAIN